MVNLKSDKEKIIMTDRQRNLVLNAIKLGGVFVTCGVGDKINIMNTRWGTLGRMWNRDVFVLPVRRKKFSHDLIDKNKCFVVNVPMTDMNAQLYKCASMSGREVNKFKELGFEPVPAKQVKSVAIAECALHLECKVIYVCEMRESKLDPIIARDMYINREYHTLYFGEIVRCSVGKK